MLKRGRHLHKALLSQQKRVQPSSTSRKNVIFVATLPGRTHPTVLLHGYSDYIARPAINTHPCLTVRSFFTFGAKTRPPTATAALGTIAAGSADFVQQRTIDV